MKWIKDSKTREKFLKMGFHRPQIHALNTNQMIINGVKIVGKVPKGRIIRILLEARRKDKADYIVCIDGDGQIPFENVFEMCFQLRNQPVDAFLSCRKGKFGISKERALIEEFELFLLGQLYGCNLPDGQCGFWGFKGELLDRLNLTAEGFEMELDFLAELLDAKPRIRFGFIEVEIRESEKTTFDVKENKNKMVFISNKLGIGIHLIKSLADRFEQINKVSLPKEYKKMLFSLTYDDISLKYPICYDGSCEDCKHRLP